MADEIRNWTVRNRKDGSVAIEARHAPDEWSRDVLAELKRRNLLAVGHWGCLGTAWHDESGSVVGVWMTATQMELGIMGNSGPQFRMHGWRGSTCGVSTYAHGWRQIVEFRELTRGHGYRIVIGPDMRPDEE